MISPSCAEDVLSERTSMAGRQPPSPTNDECGVTRGSVNRWLQWYDADHIDGLRTQIAEGPAPKLTEEQREALTIIIELGPVQAGYQSGVWTEPMIGDLIEERFGVRYHNHHVPRLLHQLKFSVHGPPKRLARADLARQATWLRDTLPAIKKSPAVPRRCCLRRRSQLLARRYAPPNMGPYWVPAPGRHVRHAQDRSCVRHRHARTAARVRPPVRAGVERYYVLRLPQEARSEPKAKLFLIIDNGPCHNLKEDGKLWLAENRHRIELFRLPPYSPELNAIEGVWKVTKKRTTHSGFYKTVEERDAALCSTFGTFQAQPP